MYQANKTALPKMSVSLHCRLMVNYAAGSVRLDHYLRLNKLMLNIPKKNSLTVSIVIKGTLMQI